MDLKRIKYQEKELNIIPRDVKSIYNMKKV